VKFWFGDIDTYGKEENEVQVMYTLSFGGFFYVIYFGI
jgi:hypothetical protein